MSFDFSIGEEQRGFLDTVDRFMARHLPPEEIRRRDGAHVPPYDKLPAMGEAGLLALPIPVAHGGMGRDWRDVGPTLRNCPGRAPRDCGNPRHGRCARSGRARTRSC